MTKLRFLGRRPGRATRDLSRRPALRRWDKVGFIVGSLIMTSLLALFAVSIVHNRAVSRTALTDRFQSRASLTASFVIGYVEDLATREESHAVRMLSQPEVTVGDFEQVVLVFGFDVAGLFDAQGR